ncbi:hypothetical protein [Pedobacter sp. Leaf132]|uniref:hypothetical protein n=1 Tax=Pedobacter sp. Leaf132 TaxID=2876557 RepID=UPI001E5388F7|nr:hypothetical protein [Pedobacter sp. Leaf132]
MSNQNLSCYASSRISLCLKVDVKPIENLNISKIKIAYINLLIQKKIIYVLFPIIFFSCKTHKEIFEKGLTYDNFRNFVPVDPIEYDDKIQLSSQNQMYNKEIKLLSTDEILEFLNNETVLVSIGKVTAEGGISYTPITISAKHSSYKVTMDYMKFATLPQVDDTKKFIGFNRVGVGLRLITLLTTNEAGINIGDLSSIGIAAKAGKVKGTMMIEVVGIKSKEVTTLLPLPSEINQTTIQNAMQALATIKSKIYDKDTRLYPQVMAIKLDTTYSKRVSPEKDKQISVTTIKNANMENALILQVGNNKMIGNRYQLAQEYENDAFKLLFSRQIDEAISKFEECETKYPGYHSVYDIINILKAQKSQLSNSDSAKWRELYARILKDYSWKLSPQIINKLKEEAK